MQQLLVAHDKVCFPTGIYRSARAKARHLLVNEVGGVPLTLLRVLLHEFCQAQECILAHAFVVMTALADQVLGKRGEASVMCHASAALQ